MRSLGRALRRTVEREVTGPQGRRTEFLFSNLPSRLPAAGRLARLARRFPLRRLPRRFGLYAAGGYLAAWLVFAMALGGHFPALLQGATSGLGYAAAQAGLGIEKVHISGHRETSERDIVGALRLGPAASLITLDPYAAQARLEEIGWVASATVKKLFPDTLDIEIVEREPLALWQIGGIVSVIDGDGASIGLLEERRHARLPMVVGYGANRAAGQLISLIDDHPRIAGRLRAAVRVAERRWNLRFDNGVEVRLPERDAAAAIAELARLDSERGLLSRDILAIDMRLDDRIVVRLSDGAAIQRKMETAEVRRGGGRT